jgi:hypothetical protein
MEGNETASPNIQTEAFSQWRVFFFLILKISGIWIVAGKFQFEARLNSPAPP